MYGEAFRIPSLGQLKMDTLGNTNLKPEKVKTFELAWIQKTANSQSTLTYFNIVLKIELIQLSLKQVRNQIDNFLILMVFLHLESN
jgi:outer membrane cobalamin receptor